MSDEDLRIALRKALGGRMQSYLERRREDLPRLGTALDSSDFDAIHRIGHDLCGSGGMYGFDRLSRVGEALEAAARAHSAEQVKTLMSDYEAALGAIAATTGAPNADCASKS